MKGQDDNEARKQNRTKKVRHIFCTMNNKQDPVSSMVHHNMYCMFWARARLANLTYPSFAECIWTLPQRLMQVRYPEPGGFVLIHHTTCVR